MENELIELRDQIIDEQDQMIDMQKQLIEQLQKKLEKRFREQKIAREDTRGGSKTIKGRPKTRLDLKKMLMN